MSATLIIRDNGEDQAIWMPWSGAFNDVLTMIAAELHGVDEALETEAREAQEGFSHYDLSRLSARRFRLFLRAAERAFNRVMGEGADSALGFTPWVMFLFSLLKALLRTDERAGKPPKHKAGWITGRDSIEWSAPWWVYDLALEHLAAQVRLEYAPLAVDLMAARISQGETRFDMSKLSPDEMRALLQGTEHLVIRYGDEKARDAYSPTFFSGVAPRVVELHKMVEGAVRASDAPV